MNAELLPPDIDPDVLADTNALVAALDAGRTPDPEVVRRIHERAEKVRRELLATHGVQNIGVDIIRELRGPLPE